MEDHHQAPGVNKIIPTLPSSWNFSVSYLGSTMMHPMYSQTMQPWVMAEVHRSRKCSKEVHFQIFEETICVSSRDTVPEDKLVKFEHDLRNVTRFAKLHQDPKCFAYLMQQKSGTDYSCHVYLADSEEEVPKIFQALRGASKGIMMTKCASGDVSSQSSIDNGSHVLDEEDSSSSKSLFEVKYVGKAKVSGKKVTSDDIDTLADEMMTKLQADDAGRMMPQSSRQSSSHTLDANPAAENHPTIRLKCALSKHGIGGLSPDTVAEVLCDFAIQTLSNPVTTEAADSNNLAEKSGAVNIDLHEDVAFRRSSHNNGIERGQGYPDGGQSESMKCDGLESSGLESLDLESSSLQDVGQSKTLKGSGLESSALESSDPESLSLQDVGQSKTLIDGGLESLDLESLSLQDAGQSKTLKGSGLESSALESSGLESSGLGSLDLESSSLQDVEQSKTLKGGGLESLVLGSSGLESSGLEFSSLQDVVSRFPQIDDGGGTELTLSFNDPPRGKQKPANSCSENTFDSCAKQQEAGQVMVLQIGQQKVTLISLDKKMAILECKFKDISSVSQGSHKQDIFGVVARESESSFSCYILKCLSGSMVVDIMNTLQMEFSTAYRHRGTGPATPASPVHTTHQKVCTSCPLLQLHRICQDINTMSFQAAYEFLVKKVQLLPDKELCELNSYMQTEQPESFEESLEVMMIFLRQMCERKQREHTHVSESNKSFKAATSMQDDRQNLFEGLKTKARRSFTTSFENIFNRSKRRDGASRNVSWTTDSDTSSWTSGDSSTTSTPDTSPMSKEFHHSYPSPPSSPGPTRKRSATLDSAGFSFRSDIQRAKSRDVNHNKSVSAGKTVTRSAENTPRRVDSLLSSTGSSPQSDVTFLPFHKHPNSSWRKAIFNRVCTPQHSSDYDEDHSLSKLHNREEIRATWKKAILETLLLIRLEKENHSIQARQEDGETGPCKKLDYQELTPCLKEITSVWRKMLSAQSMDGEHEVVAGRRTLQKAELVECVKKGVPRSLRGQIWLFLMQQLQKGGAVPDSGCSYQELLKQLTTHQHAILIDLGRTFPNHPYFSTSLGAGQLELFNLLKAYSLLDAEVGYCQGLSFIVGMLLMHMEEISAFEVLKYIMYDLGLRQQFRPNMMALQVKLYQLTRLLHDHYKDVYDHFEHHEISPSLYAAPWFLTLFASQFPLGFVARVFDMIFVQGISALLKVALMLIGNHRALILQCDSFETVVDFLKITLPEMVQVQMERIINQAFELDIERELHACEVEYHVLSEEVSFSAPNQLLRQQQQQNQRRNSQLNQQAKVVTSPAIVTAESMNRRVERRRMSIDLEMLYRLENHNRALKNQNLELLEKLQQAQCLRESCEHSVLVHQVERDKLRSHIQALELERAALLSAVAKLQTLVPQDALQHFSIPQPVANSSAQLNLVKTLNKEQVIDHQGFARHQKDSAQTVDQMTSIPDNSKNPDLITSSSDRPCHAGNSPSANTACITSSPRRNEEQRASPALDVHISERNPQKISITVCGEDNIIIPQSSLDDEPLPRAVCVPSSSSSTMPSSTASSSSSAINHERRTIPVQRKSSADSHTSTTVSSARQVYFSRSISNVSSNSSSAGSVTPEERRKSITVVVQQSPTTTNSHQKPGSQR